MKCTLITILLINVGEIPLSNISLTNQIMGSYFDPQTIIITIIFCHSIKAEILISVLCMYSATAAILAIPPAMKLEGAMLFYSLSNRYGGGIYYI